MKTIGQLLEEILLESILSNDEIVDAIDNHKKFIATYKPVTNGHEHATGPRLIGFFAYGVTKRGNECVRIFEYAGDTASFVPDWKLMLTSQFETLKETGQTYDEPPAGYNPEGDRTMAQVYKIAKFGEENTGATKQNEPYMSDTEKQIRKRGEKIRQQMANPINIKDLEKPKTTSVPANTEPQKPELFKTDTERGLEKLRQQLQNPRKIDLDQNKPTLKPGEAVPIKDIVKNTKPAPQEKPIQEPVQEPTQQVQSEPEQPKHELKPGEAVPIKDIIQKKTPELYKTDTERGLENLKNQLQNAKKIDLTKIPKR